MTPQVGWLGRWRLGDTGRIEASLRLPRIRNTTLHLTDIKTAFPFNSINGSVSVCVDLLNLEGLAKCKRPVESLILPGCRNKNKCRSPKTRVEVSVAEVWRNVIHVSLKIVSLSIVGQIPKHFRAEIKISRIFISAKLLRVRVKAIACNSP